MPDRTDAPQAGSAPRGDGTPATGSPARGGGAARTDSTDRSGAAARYVIPAGGLGSASLKFFNFVVAGLTKAGISVLGSRVLHVRGRTSGEWRTTPVNLLRYEGGSYLVAPRGHTQWVRNMRAAGGGELHVGRRVEAFTATELADADKPAILRAYLRRWKMEIGVFFDGVGLDATDAQLLDIAPGYPVFRLAIK